ncbi:MAG: hypothetical protein LBF74_07190 [Treponema sp.]|jgi:hypothetical protein|nr:hypothetical protein [Treponema sp.]
MNTGTGHIGTMRVSHNLDGVIIQGSIAKYLHGENMTPLSRNGVKMAIEKLDTAINLSLSGVAVGSIEIGTSIILRENPGEYLRLFGDMRGYTKTAHSKYGFLKTVSYGTPTGAYQFCAYDKGREMADKKQPIPALFSGKHVLRLEYRIVRRRGIRNKLGQDITAYDLFNYEVYRRLQSLFLEVYQAIPKTGRVVYIDKSKPMTPALLERLQAEQWRQSYPEKYNAVLQSLTESGSLTAKNIERIRAKDRRQGRDFSMSDKSPLIAELDNHVRTAAKSGA